MYHLVVCDKVRHDTVQLLVLEVVAELFLAHAQAHGVQDGDNTTLTISS